MWVLTVRYIKCPKQPLVLSRAKIQILNKPCYPSIANICCPMLARAHLNHPLAHIAIFSVCLPIYLSQTRNNSLDRSKKLKQ